ncbi:MAG: glucose-1-phosphate adenylyltransferase subunit GlgD [Defluviitaleaceae bacterium]|nr:glucose-1-phosphate adenylyltransferase subunit GlgD [Defluviitaleaceae bacterium]
MRAVGIILAGGNNENLGALTAVRATSAMPVGACYRALDFPLSNMSNSGIGKVAIITQYNSRSLHDHLSSAKWWDLGRKQGGLFVFSPYLSNDNSLWYKGTADSIHKNLAFLKRSKEPYVVIANGNCVYKMDYNEVLDYHERKDSEITLVYKKAECIEDAHLYGVLELDDDERCTDIDEKPLEPQSDLISLGIYVVSRTLLIKLLEAVNAEGRNDLVKDIFARYRKRLRIYGYKYDGYWRTLNNIRSYFECNMDFLKKDVRDLFTRQYPYIETKPKDEPPAKYNNGANVADCLVGSGAILNGYARHSVLSRKVYTGEYSSIRDSIVMEGCYIGNNCLVENAILDKEVILSDGRHVIGDKENPVIIAKGTVV